MSTETFWGKYFSEKILPFFVKKNTFIQYHFRTISEVFQPSGKLLRQGCLKYSLWVHRNILREVFMKEMFSRFFGYWPKLFRPAVGKFSMGLSKLHFTCSRRTPWRERIGNFLDSFFDFKRKNFQVFLETSSMVLSKLIFAFPEEYSGQKIVFWKHNRSPHCRTLNGKTIGFVDIFLAGRSKRYSTCPQEFFEEKDLFEKQLFRFTTLGKWATFFGFLSKNFGSGGQNCNLHVQRKKLRKTVFLWKIYSFYHLYRILNENISNFIKLPLAGMSKLHSASP